MSVVLFIVILVILILVHEIGHFVVAKRAGIRVDEFGLGYPPRVWSKQIGETRYSLNLLPFGGFVKIFGEDPDDESISGPEKKRSFVHKPRPIQISVLIAGIAANILFAWLLLSAGLMVGLPSSIEPGTPEAENASLMIVEVLPGSPAETAGLRAGDVIGGISAGGNELAELVPGEASAFIKERSDGDISFQIERGGEELAISATPAEGVIAERKAVGISMDLVGMLRLPAHRAFYEGAKTTWNLSHAIVVGLGSFFAGAFTGGSDFSEVTGPVGIAGLVGDASSLGFAYLLTFTAFISLNLAIINLVPFPALDGGRILFVLIEAIRRKPLNPAITNTANFVGFAILILLMVVVTVKDISKLL